MSAETQAPIGGARVEVTGSGSADSLRRSASGTDGRFRVQGLRPGAYRVRISALGFSPRELAQVIVGAAAPTVDAGTVALTPAAVELSSVVVRSRKADVELAPDRNAYVVHDMPTTRGGT
ncbi:MAG: carboxypeptidase-like regulatory domain-containing protein, partial [Gemmatimonadales bacterium]